MKKLLFLMIVGSVFFVGVGCDPGSGSREEICDNGIDDDGDWFVDCADIACVGRPGDSEGHLCQITEQNCHDGFDNDGDGMTDMEDPDCFAAGEICDNDMDDDGDGDVDCDDSDCVSSVVCQTTEICDNGTDDDGDGDVDCDDPDCLDSEACVAVENCTNETDDDGDGDVDCDDADCTLDPACVLGEDCANGIDDDSDTYTDCADPECDGETGPGGGLCEAVEASCADGYDNDGDGEADCNDADCASSAECQTVEICDNGTDDDSDGLIDCLDPQCAGQQGPLGGICEVMESSCFDGYDNDGDGDMDCDDSDCALACMVAGDLVITEFIKDPNDLADSIGEWFELYNPTARDIDLRGLVIFSEGGSGEVTHVIASGAPVLLQAGEYMVLGPQGSILANPAVPVSYEYAGISLSNTSDNLGIRTGDGTLVDEIMYDEANYHTFSGMSHSLDRDNLTAAANDIASNWCHVTAQYNGVDYGTPGLANPSCIRESDCGDTLDNDGNGMTDCEDFACAYDSVCTMAQIPLQGDLVVTEIMADPGTGAQTYDYEWFEIHNTAAVPVELNGLTVCDDFYTDHCFFLNLGGTTPLAAGGYVVLASDSANVAGATVLYSYGAALQLGNASDGVVLLRGEGGGQVFIDMVSYDAASGWPVVAGAAMQLSSHIPADFMTNDVAANWCAAGFQYDSVNHLYGTPGVANDSCVGSSEDCANGTDDDGDGLSDCADPDCAGQAGPGGGTCEASEVSCSDGYDNDGDGLTDGVDPDCGAGFAAQLYLWEVDSDTPGTDMLEFLEVWNNTGVTVDFASAKYFLLFIDGSSHAVYRAVQLTGTIGPDAVMVIGSDNVTGVDIALGTTTGILQNGPDGLILVRCDDCTDNAGAEWPASTVLGASAALVSVLSSADATRIDGIAYDTDDADETTLMSYCGVSVQWNENQGGNKDTWSLNRVDPVTWATALASPDVK